MAKHIREDQIAAGFREIEVPYTSGPRSVLAFPGNMRTTEEIIEALLKVEAKYGRRVKEGADCVRTLMSFGWLCGETVNAAEFLQMCAGNDLEPGGS